MTTTTETHPQQQYRKLKRFSNYNPYIWTLESFIDDTRDLIQTRPPNTITKTWYRSRRSKDTIADDHRKKQHNFGVKADRPPRGRCSIGSKAGHAAPSEPSMPEPKMTDDFEKMRNRKEEKLEKNRESRPTTCLWKPTVISRKLRSGKDNDFKRENRGCSGERKLKFLSFFLPWPRYIKVLVDKKKKY